MCYFACVCCVRRLRLADLQSIGEGENTGHVFRFIGEAGVRPYLPHRKQISYMPLLIDTRYGTFVGVGTSCLKMDAADS